MSNFYSQLIRINKFLFKFHTVAAQDTLNVAMQRMEEQRPSSTPHHGLWGARPVDEIETLGVKGGRGTIWLGRKKKVVRVTLCH